MSVPRSRLLDLMKAQCRIFATTFNPERLRMGNKILRQRLRGPSLAAYYPRKVATIQDLRREFAPEFIGVDEWDDERKEQNENLRARGKARPRRGSAAAAKASKKKRK